MQKGRWSVEIVGVCTKKKKKEGQGEGAEYMNLGRWDFKYSMVVHKTCPLQDCSYSLFCLACPLR